MKKYYPLFLLIIFLVSCAKETKESTQEKKFSVGMVTDTGGVNDQSFNQTSWEGLQRAQAELGVNSSYLESTQPADYEVNLDTFAANETDLIFGIGFLMQDIVLQEAERYPDGYYAIIDGSYGDETPENLVGVLFEDQQSSFLVGYIAARMSQTNKIGFIGGIRFTITERFELGYKAGALYANPDIEIMSVFAESFSDTAKGKAIATQMYLDDADVIFHAAGGLGDGVIEAAREQNLWAIGVDRDQSSQAPENVLTSAIKRVDNAAYALIQQLQQGTFPHGETLISGLEQNAVGIAPNSNGNIPPEIMEEVNLVTQKLIDKEISLPYDIQELKALYQ